MRGSGDYLHQRGLDFGPTGSNLTKQMGTTLFGNADPVVVASVMPQDMMIVRGVNGCAMASDRH
jgi:hypothetical protein